MAKKRAAKPKKRTQSAIPFTKLCKCGHYNHNRKVACELCGAPLKANKKKTQPKKSKKPTKRYAGFQTKSAAALDYLTAFGGNFDEAVEFLSGLKPLVDNKAS